MPCCPGDGKGQVQQFAPGLAEKAAKKKIDPKRPITFTREAALFIRDAQKKEGKETWALKIEVIPGGCAGFSYYMGFEEKPELGEQMFDIDGLKVIMNLMSLQFIAGSEIEFVSELMQGTGLKVNNPNAKKGCACGKSFG